ncbi:MAG: site-specific tyrosine recombinase XerD [Vulcanimicrobiaceae bacterium]
MTDSLFPIAAVGYALPPAVGRHIETFVHGRPPATVDAYRRALVDCFATLRLPIGAIALEDLQAYADELRARYCDADGPTASVRVRLYAIRRFFRFAAAQGWVARNPALELQVPKPRRIASRRVLSHEEVMAMIYKAANERDRILLRTLYVTGLRVSELCRLRCYSVQLHPDGYGILLVDGKGNRPRELAFPASLYADLVRVKGAREATAPLFTGGHRYAAGRALPIPPGDWPMTRDGVLRIVARAAARAGIVDKAPTPHWLRHAHIAHALHNGADVFATSRTAGHASVSTTAVYAHPKARDSSAFFVRG